MSRHPAKEPLVATLIETARRVAMDSTAEHPEDVANAMTFAIEAAAIALQIVHEGSRPAPEIGTAPDGGKA